MRQFFASMSHRSRIAFAAGLFLIVCVIGGAVWWIMHPPYGVLFGDLRESDAAEITAALGQMQVPYRLADEGKTILVPDEEVYGTRMKLVSQGVPKGGSVGFELFKDSDYGVTEFAQRVNFQRALQGELERTISSLTEVTSARVHLTIHHAGLFEHDQETSKASVTIDLRPMKHLNAREVFGVQRLVASAVEGLVPESVVVLDDKGVVLSGNPADGSVSVSDRLDQQTRMRTELRTRVGQLLHRVLLSDDFTVSVDVRLNYDHVKKVSERLLAQGTNGNGLLVREKVNATRSVANSAGSEQGKGGPTSNDRELEYAHGREQEEVERAPGRIERISVGIVVPSSLSKGEIDKLSEVVSAGLGLDPARGDRVDIAAIAAVAVAAAEHSKDQAPAAETSLDAIEHGSQGGLDVAKAIEPVHSSVAVAWWIFPAVAGAILIVLAGLLKASRNVPRRLPPPEREEALAQLRQWIESSEAGR